MRLKRFLSLLCALMVIVSPFAAFSVYADNTDTVYIRKHISLLYDNSGSMSMDIGDKPNLKWSYASYAAQIFAGLLNDTDSLSFTFMNKVGDMKTLDIDLASDRQGQVDKIKESTNYASGDTPIESVADAKQALIDNGLLSNAQIGSNQIDQSEQYWLVLTTDGNFSNVPVEEFIAQLEEMLKNYSNLQVVYFGIGAEGDETDEAAKDLRENSTLNSYSNFTAVYADEQTEIVSTMRSLANRISGRYSVSDDIKQSDNKVTLRISGESSPIRNIAVLAQKTEAALLSATAEDGTNLMVTRPASIKYPVNDNYDCMPAGTKGGLTALITNPEGKLPPGTITLEFSEKIPLDELDLMYEPAVYVDLTIQYQDSEGNWVDVPYGQKVLAEQQLKVNYVVCEDGTGEPVDVAKLPGVTTAQISSGDRDLEAETPFQLPVGNTTLTATVSMMDGAYVVNAVRNITVQSLSAYSYEVSDALQFYPEDIKSNTSAYIDFKILYEGKSATAEQLSDFRIESGELKGLFTTPEEGVFRFTPQHADCKLGEYKVDLCFIDTSVASQTVTVREPDIYYTAEAGEPLALFTNELSDNQSAITFKVTCHTGDKSAPLAEENVAEFTIEAEASDGSKLKGEIKYQSDGSLSFIPNDPDSKVGDYIVTLMWKDNKLAESKISVMQYNAEYSAVAYNVGDKTLDRLNLLNNTNGIAFVIYADGEPISQSQLEAMLSEQLVLSNSPESGMLRLKTEIGTYDGKTALIVTPTTTAGNRFFAALQKPMISWGAVKRGNLEIVLTVNTVNKASATGVMDVVNDFGQWLFWFLILIIILLILGLIAWVVFCNITMPRITSGTLRYIRIDVTKAYANISTESSKIHRWKPYLKLNRRPEMITFEGLTLFAEKRVFWQTSNPHCRFSSDDAFIHSYYRQSPGFSANEFIGYLDNAGRQSFPKADMLSMWADTPVVREDIEVEDRYIYQQIESGGYIMRKDGNGNDVDVVHLWIFTANNDE